MQRLAQTLHRLERVGHRRPIAAHIPESPTTRPFALQVYGLNDEGVSAQMLSCGPDGE
jgi:hypothetical protein